MIREPHNETMIVVVALDRRRFSHKAIPNGRRRRSLPDYYLTCVRVVALPLISTFSNPRPLLLIRATAIIRSLSPSPSNHAIVDRPEAHQGNQGINHVSVCPVCPSVVSAVRARGMLSESVPRLVRTTQSKGIGVVHLSAICGVRSWHHVLLCIPPPSLSLPCSSRKIAQAN